MGFTIHEVKNKDLLERFIEFPFQLYKDNPYWTPPLKSEEQSFLIEVPQLDPGIETRMYVCLNESGDVVGRIQIIINHHEIDFSGENIGRFNKMDFIDNVEVCRLLLSHAEDWLKSKNIAMIIGPFGYSNLDPAGFLTKGFDMLSNTSTIYNYPYYENHLRECGYEDYLAWIEHIFSVPEAVPEKVIKFSKLVSDRYNLRPGNFNTKAEKKLMSTQILELINICYAHLPGFVPLSDELKDYYFKKYMPLVNKDFISLIVNADNDLIGFGLTIPCYTKALQKANGTLFPFGFYYLWRATRYNDRAEMLLIAVHPDYQQKGVTSLIFEQIMQKYIENGIKKVESNPEQVENMNVRNLWKGYDFILHKKRICLSKELS